MKKNNRVLVRQEQTTKIIRYMISAEGMFPGGCSLTNIEENTRVHKKYLEGQDGLLAEMIKANILEDVVTSAGVFYRMRRNNN